MAIDIFNNFNLNAPKPIEQRFEFKRVIDAIEGGYEYPDGATHYFTEAGGDYPAGLYKYEAGAWTLVSTGREVPDDIAYLRDVEMITKKVTHISGFVTDGANGRGGVAVGKSNAEMVTLGYVDDELNIKDEYCSVSVNERPLPFSVLSTVTFEVLNSFHNNTNAALYVNGYYVFGEYKFYNQLFVQDAVADELGGISAAINSRTLDMSTSNFTRRVYTNIAVNNSDGTYTLDHVSVTLTPKFANDLGVGATLYGITNDVVETSTKLENSDGSKSYAITNAVTESEGEIPTSKAVVEYVAEHGGGGSGTTNYDNLINKPLVKESDGSYSSVSDITLNKGTADEVRVAEKLATLEQEKTSKFTPTLEAGVKIGEVEDINGNKQNVYAPRGGEGGGATSIAELEDGNRVTDLENTINGQESVESVEYSIVGKGIQRSNGAFVTASALSSTDYIPLDGVVKVEARGRDYNAYAISAFYDEQKKWISSYYPDAQARGNITIALTEFPEGAKYIVIQSQNADAQRFVRVTRLSDGLTARVDKLEQEDIPSERVVNPLTGESVQTQIDNIVSSSSVRDVQLCETDGTIVTNVPCLLRKGITYLLEGLTDYSNYFALYARVTPTSSNVTISLAFPHDGKLLYTPTEDYTILRFTASQGKEPYTPIKLRVTNTSTIDYRLTSAETDILDIKSDINNIYDKIDTEKHIKLGSVSYELDSSCEGWDRGMTDPAIHAEALYDSLMSENQGYISKVNCKTDSGIQVPSYMDGGIRDGLILPMPLYHFKPVSYDDSSLVRIMLISGVHGEAVGVQSLFEFCKRLANAETEEMKALKNGIELYVIPYVNPSCTYITNKSTSEHPVRSGGRLNWNLVNPNRNFPTKGWSLTHQWNDDGTPYMDWSGEEAGSEYETKIVMHYANELQPDIFIDCHNSASINDQTPEMGSYVWVLRNQSTDRQSAITKRVCNDIMPLISKLIQHDNTTDYPQAYTHKMAYLEAEPTKRATTQNWFAEAFNAIAYTCEGANQEAWKNGQAIPMSERVQVSAKPQFTKYESCAIESIIKRTIQELYI